MHPKRKFECNSVVANNGIVKVQFTNFDGYQPETVYINVVAPYNQYQQGQFYWIHIEPAFPH